MSLSKSTFNFLCIETSDDQKIYVNPYILSMYSTLFTKILETNETLAFVIKLEGTLACWKRLINDVKEYLNRLENKETHNFNAAIAISGSIREVVFTSDETDVKFVDYMVFLDYIGLDEDFVSDLFIDWIYCPADEKTIESNAFIGQDLSRIPENLHDILCFETLKITIRENTIETQINYHYYNLLKRINPKKAAQLADVLIVIRCDLDSFLSLNIDKFPYNIIRQNQVSIKTFGR